MKAVYQAPGEDRPVVAAVVRQSLRQPVPPGGSLTDFPDARRPLTGAATV